MDRLTLRIESQNRVIMSDFMPVSVCDRCRHKQNCSQCSFYTLLKELANYEDLGTVKEFQRLKVEADLEKQTVAALSQGGHRK